MNQNREFLKEFQCKILSTIERKEALLNPTVSVCGLICWRIETIYVVYKQLVEYLSSRHVAEP